ncbi:COG3014 family protein [Pseudomonas sp. CBC3]|uniref:COG3014 family protein n=1 Tax=Pseudomonas sp. CBC3 TaxID=3123318 RepID=UPI0030E88907
MTRLAKAALSVGLGLLLSGCETFRSYETELTAVNQHILAGDPDAALMLLEKHNSREQKDLLYYFEKGELLRAKGDLEGSQAAWSEADQVITAWEESIKLDTEKYLTEFGSLLVNDKVRRYEGYDYEKVMLTTQLALNRLARNDFEQARMDIKRTHEREAFISQLRDREYLKREQEAQEKGITAQFKDLQGYPVEVLDAPEVLSLKNSYQSAFSHYLSGFVYEALGEKGLAAPGYRKAIELRPGEELLEDALVRLDAPAPTTDESEVLIVVQNGLAPARDSVRIPLPIPTSTGIIVTPFSFPVIKSESQPTAQTVRLDDQELTLAQLNSIDAMSRRALRDDMPGIILRTSVRAISRSVMQKQLNDNVSPLAGLAVGLMSAITEGADERTWRTLPDQTLVARARIRRGEHSLSLPNGTIAKVRIDQPYQVIPLRVIGGQVFAAGSAVELPAPLTRIAQAQ